MISVFLGVFLFFLPFILVFCYEDRIRAFLYISVIDIIFHTSVGLITQAFHIFSYPLILSIHIAVACIVLSTFFYKKRFFAQIRLDWFVVIFFAIIIFQFFSVHYLYTGPVSTINGSFNSVRSSYPYPYFSDEWVGVAFVNYSIHTQSLPIINPLTQKEPFTNLLVVFFSCVSEIILLLNQSALVIYPIFAVCSGFFVCLLTYLTLRTYGVGKYASVFAALSIPYVVNSSNLPGAWYFLPFIVSFCFLLVSYMAWRMREYPLVFMGGVLAFALYPPIIVFFIPLLFILCKQLMSWRLVFNRRDFLIIVYLISFAVVSLFIISVSVGFNHIISFLENVFSLIIRPGYESGTDIFAPWFVIPWITFPLFFIGIYGAFRKKVCVLLGLVSVGILFWIIYSFVPHIFIIDFPRVVIISAFLVVLLSGFGLDILINELKKRKPGVISYSFISRLALIFICVIFSFFYTRQSMWKHLVVVTHLSSHEIRTLPASPATQLLTRDDMRIFSSLSGEKFIAPPWKGLVIGAVTPNYPLESKVAFVTKTSPFSYEEFYDASCDEKDLLAQKVRLDYVYSRSFNCKHFSLIDSSSEYLYLYKFTSY